MKYDVRFVVCSDNPSLHGKGLSYDYEELFNETEDINMIKKMLDNQYKYTFLKINNET